MLIRPVNHPFALPSSPHLGRYWPCSYFYEALENFDAISHARGVDCLKYMLLCKIMMNSPDEVRVPSASPSLDQCFSRPLCVASYVPNARVHENNELSFVSCSFCAMSRCVCVTPATLPRVAAAVFATGLGDYKWQAWNAPPGPRD